jgi:hypothetical protein
MPELSSNKEYENWLKHEIFSGTCIPPETSFFLRLDGWKFKELSEAVGAEKPFDKRFAKCLVSSAKIFYKKGFNPTLVYVARRRVKENWRIPLFTSKQGTKLLEQIIKWHIIREREKAKT